MSKKPTYAELEQRIQELEAQVFDRNRAEGQLPEHLFSVINSTIPALIYVYDMVTQCNVYSNDGIERLLGYTPQEVQAMGPDLFSRLIHPDDLSDVITFQSKIMAAKDDDILEIEYRLKHKEGRWLNLYSYERPLIRNPDASLKQKIGIAIDNTERVKTQEALARSETLLRRTFEAIPDLLTVHDRNLRVVLSNWHEHDYVPKNERIRQPYCYSVYMNRDKPCEPCHALEVFETGKAKCLEKTNPVDGITREINVYPIVDENGVVTMVTEHIRDITEHKRAKEEKEELENQLRQAQKMEAVGRLAGGVAHDFNNMLSVILGNSEMALEQMDLDQPLKANLQEIKKAALRSADITRQLLAYARKQTIAPKVLNLNKTLQNMLKMIRRLIGENINLVWLPGKALWPVQMDPSQIDQILANLCVNARDAIAGVGKITIETGKTTFDEDYCAYHPGFIPGDFVLLAVSDDGCGMDKETLNNLFEPFFTTKDVDKGTGLGLATVYGIVKQNNGFINVYSEPNRGTTFKIYLPRHEIGEEQVRGKRIVRSAVQGSETILLVEDEPSILSMTTQMLERLGYIVLAAVTPLEAIGLAREHGGNVHLLMTDVIMPEMNGRDLASNLLSTYPNLKRLFMSGYTANVIAHHGVLDEGVNFIQKPFSTQDLSVKVREVLDEDNTKS